MNNTNTVHNKCLLAIDGESGKIRTVDDINIWEPLQVKMQSIKTAIESATMLIRIDDIVSGIKKSGKGQPTVQKHGGGEHEETFGDARDG